LPDKKFVPGQLSFNASLDEPEKKDKDIMAEIEAELQVKFIHQSPL
jgi:hypothetical protein